MDLTGCVIYDNFLTPRRRGVIVAMATDTTGTVLVAWDGHQPCEVRPEPGRYDVIVKAWEQA
jgi:hypothetical protein